MSRKRIVSNPMVANTTPNDSVSSDSDSQKNQVEDVHTNCTERMHIKQRKHLSYCKYCGKIHDVTNEPCKELIQHRIERNKLIKRSRAAKYRSTIDWQKTRERILLRDGGVCRLCLKKGILISVGIQVHHITKVEDDYELRNVDSNLISLCSTCHAIVEDVTDYDDDLRDMAGRCAFLDLIVGRGRLVDSVGEVKADD